MISIINATKEIMRLYVSPSTVDYAKELAPYLLVDRSSTARRGDRAEFLFDYDADSLKELSDVALVYSEDKKFIISFVTTSFLIDKDNESSLENDAHFLALLFLTKLIKVGINELINSLSSPWTTDEIYCVDRRGDDNELILDHIEYDIGHDFDEIEVFGSNNEVRYGICFRYIFNWTIPSKYVPSIGSTVGGRSFEKAKLHFFVIFPSREYFPTFG